MLSSNTDIKFRYKDVTTNPRSKSESYTLVLRSLKTIKSANIIQMIILIFDYLYD